ncbi:AAA domain protein [[Clostridium] sordellii ATCC 9714]|nr:AAA domain protein [[Clostridium] sordellii ATCC 9714] [Paeniclostridium sordellii ATCC 9714]
MDEEDLKDKYDKEHFTRYKVNLLVDNGLDQEQAPVILEINPSPANLFGKAEYEYYNGTVKTALLNYCQELFIKQMEDI